MNSSRRFENDWTSNRALGRFEWRSARIYLLLFIALVLSLLLSGWITRPGVHLAGTTVALDILLWRHARSNGRALILSAPLSFFALLVILFGSATVEQWFTSVYGLYAIFLLLAPNRRDTSF
ncbi:hypothetical protein LLE49_20475 [Alicyclobacillus tolerans]|uniref:hypothetical protein n=1 Tax=Alicyclobacillus tolerans TaxID=90970 RepID=UPI001F1A8DF3|nr:hypothetical protein [Alicyclobacillus tolerans]MCF8567097.1 hypothetical protein [Alicyclobacillus tolerans]